MSCNFHSMHSHRESPFACTISSYVNKNAIHHFQLKCNSAVVCLVTRLRLYLFSFSLTFAFFRNFSKISMDRRIEDRNVFASCFWTQLVVVVQVWLQNFCVRAHAQKKEQSSWLNGVARVDSFSLLTILPSCGQHCYLFYLLICCCAAAAVAVAAAAVSAFVRCLFDRSNEYVCVCVCSATAHAIPFVAELFYSVLSLFLHCPFIGLAHAARSIERYANTAITRIVCVQIILVFTLYQASFIHSIACLRRLTFHCLDLFWVFSTSSSNFRLQCNAVC